MTGTAPEALNVMNMVRTFEDAGAGAVHIEEQLYQPFNLRTRL